VKNVYTTCTVVLAYPLKLLYRFVILRSREGVVSRTRSLISTSSAAEGSGLVLKTARWGGGARITLVTRTHTDWSEENNIVTQLMHLEGFS
jgi:hypothetical protein